MSAHQAAFVAVSGPARGPKCKSKGGLGKSVYHQLLIERFAIIGIARAIIKENTPHCSYLHRFCTGVGIMAGINQSISRYPTNQPTNQPRYQPPRRVFRRPLGRETEPRRQQLVSPSSPQACLWVCLCYCSARWSTLQTTTLVPAKGGCGRPRMSEGALCVRVRVRVRH